MCGLAGTPKVNFYAGSALERCTWACCDALGAATAARRRSRAALLSTILYDFGVTCAQLFSYCGISQASPPTRLLQPPKTHLCAPIPGGSTRTVNNGHSAQRKVPWLPQTAHACTEAQVHHPPCFSPGLPPPPEQGRNFWGTRKKGIFLADSF